jgi:hypothetical protein
MPRIGTAILAALGLPIPVVGIAAIVAFVNGTPLTWDGALTLAEVVAVVAFFLGLISE